MKQAKVMMTGPGPGRNTALQTICRSGIFLNFVSDIPPRHIMNVDLTKKDVYKFKI